MHNQFGYIHIIIVILISIMAVGLVGAAWYYENNREVSTALTATTSTIIDVDTNSNSNTATVVERNWQTIAYKSDDHNFTFDIPEDWELIEQTAHNEERKPFVTVFDEQENHVESMTVSYYKNSSRTLVSWAGQHKRELRLGHNDIIESESDWTENDKIIIAAEMKEIFKHMYCYVQGNDVVYEIYFFSEIDSWARYKDIFQKACDSFTIPIELADT